MTGTMKTRRFCVELLDEDSVALTTKNDVVSTDPSNQPDFTSSHNNINNNSQNNINNNTDHDDLVSCLEYQQFQLIQWGVIVYKAFLISISLE